METRERRGRSHFIIHSNITNKMRLIHVKCYQLLQRTITASHQEYIVCVWSNIQVQCIFFVKFEDFFPLKLLGIVLCTPNVDEWNTVCCTSMQVVLFTSCHCFQTHCSCSTCSQGARIRTCSLNHFSLIIFKDWIKHRMTTAEKSEMFIDLSKRSFNVMKNT